MVSKGKIWLKGGGVEIAACLEGEREGDFLTLDYFNKQVIIWWLRFYKQFIIKFNFRFKKNGRFQLNKSSIIKYKLKQIIFYLFWYCFNS